MIKKPLKHIGIRAMEKYALFIETRATEILLSQMQRETKLRTEAHKLAKKRKVNYIA